MGRREKPPEHCNHGVSFEQARRIFDGFTVDMVDDRLWGGSELSPGVMGAVTLLAVVHTDRQGTCRLISARPANRREKKHKEIRKTFDA